MGRGNCGIGRRGAPAVERNWQRDPLGNRRDHQAHPVGEQRGGQRSRPPRQRKDRRRRRDNACTPAKSPPWSRLRSSRLGTPSKSVNASPKAPPPATSPTRWNRLPTTPADADAARQSAAEVRQVGELAEKLGAGASFAPEPPDRARSGSRFFTRPGRSAECARLRLSGLPSECHCPRSPAIAATAVCFRCGLRRRGASGCRWKAPAGAGKTSLLRIVAELAPATDGRIEWTTARVAEVPRRVPLTSRTWAARHRNDASPPSRERQTAPPWRSRPLDEHTALCLRRIWPEGPAVARRSAVAGRSAVALACQARLNGLDEPFVAPRRGRRQPASRDSRRAPVPGGMLLFTSHQAVQARQHPSSLGLGA